MNYDTMCYKCYKGALQKILSTDLFSWATSVISRQNKKGPLAILHKICDREDPSSHGY